MQIFFIVGRARSGNTLLARMLGLHPQLALAPESLFVANLQRKYRNARWNARTIDAFVRDVLRDEGVSGWGLDARRLSQRLHERAQLLRFGEACRIVYASYARDVLGRNAIAIGDANSRHALFLSRLERAFPDARYVHVTRDYRANMRSFFRAAFDWGSPAALAQRWKKYNEAILDQSRKTPERSLWLRHEDLVAYPEHELSRVCRFLGVEFDPRMLAPVAGSEPPQTAAHLARVEAWQRDLPETAIRQADAICGGLGERFGYQRSPDGEALPLLARIGVLYGSSSVLAEKFVFGVLPAGLRVGLLNAYNVLSARVAAGKPLVRPKRA